MGEGHIVADEEVSLAEKASTWTVKELDHGLVGYITEWRGTIYSRKVIKHQWKQNELRTRTQHTAVNESSTLQTLTAITGRTEVKAYKKRV